MDLDELAVERSPRHQRRRRLGQLCRYFRDPARITRRAASAIEQLKPELGKRNLRRTAHNDGMGDVSKGEHVSPNRPDLSAGAPAGRGTPEGQRRLRRWLQYRRRQRTETPDGDDNSPSGTDTNTSSTTHSSNSTSGHDLGAILESVTAHLGPNVELSLEVRAASDEIDDRTIRTVSKNGNIGATNTFE